MTDGRRPTHAPRHATRPKFDTLFADPRHYRGDCRLMRTAIRRGWLDAAPQADRDALLARFEAAFGERREESADADGVEFRKIMAEARAMIDATAANQRVELWAMRTSWTGGKRAYTTGRPRDRWHVGDYAHRIDANAVRRRALADGIDLRTLQAIELSGVAGGRVGLAVVADARYGWRLWLVCPRCERRRVHLYPLKRGVMCRECGRIRHS